MEPKPRKLKKPAVSQEIPKELLLYFNKAANENKGRVIVTDKANKRIYYGTRNKDGFFDLNTFEVLTGANDDPKKGLEMYQDLPIEQLDKEHSKKDYHNLITPIGKFAPFEKTVYGQMGLYYIPGNKNTSPANHITYPPQLKERNNLYDNGNLEDNATSYGCINGDCTNQKKLTDFFKKGDFAYVVDTRLSESENTKVLNDWRYIKIGKTTKPTKNTIVKSLNRDIQNEYKNTSDATNTLKNTKKDVKENADSGVVNKKYHSITYLPATYDTTKDIPTVNFGLHGEIVKNKDTKILDKQKNLIAKGYDIKADGVWGPKSEQAQKDFDANIAPIEKTTAESSLVKEKPVDLGEPYAANFKKPVSYEDITLNSKTKYPNIPYNAEQVGNIPYDLFGSSMSYIPKDMIREDGTIKGHGFLGDLPNENEKISSELSISTSDIEDGKETLIPALVPTLTQEEVNYLLSNKYDPSARQGIDNIISKKAIDFARDRKLKNLPFFATKEEEGTFKVQQPVQQNLPNILPQPDGTKNMQGKNMISQFGEPISAPTVTEQPLSVLSKDKFNPNATMELSGAWKDLNRTRAPQPVTPEINTIETAKNQNIEPVKPVNVKQYSTTYRPYEGLVNLFDVGLNTLAAANQKNQQQKSFKPEQPDTVYYNKRMLRGDNQMFAKNGGEYREGGEFEVDDNELENLRAQGYEFDIMEDGGEGEPKKKPFVVPPFNSVVTDLNKQPIDNTSNKQVATSTGIPKKVLGKKAQTQIDAKAYSNVYEENARKERLIDAEKASNTPYASDNWQDVLARTSQATGDKLRFSDKTNFFDDYINPFSMIGSMAAGVGSMPQDLQQGEYAKAALALGVPLGAGLLGGIGAKTTGQFVNNMVNPLAGFGGKSASGVNDVVTSLRKELSEKGIISQQKTLNLPWKDPIRKGIDPWGYDIKSKVDDIKSLFINSNNKSYLTPEKIDRVYNTYLKLRRPTEELLSKDDYLKTINKAHLFKTRREVVDSKFTDRFSDENSLSRKNRYTTWDMYLGKPQTEHPMYDISSLTKSKDDVIYTIKKDFINTKEVENRLNEYIDDIISLEKKGKKRMTMIAENDMVKKGDSWIIPDSDSNVFGTMGGFHWKIDKMPDGNYKVLANDIWDLQPFKNTNIGNSDKLSGRLLNSVVKPIRNIEVGKTLGIGKPLNVKVGFILDGDTKKIINTFGLAPAAIATGIGMSQQNKKYGGERKLKKPSYAEGGEYEVSDKEIQRLKKLGYEFETV